MKILMVNKFLYENGGSETYMLKLGEHLKTLGHLVEFFGMEHQERCVGNSVNMYTTNMDFHKSSKANKIMYSIKTIYSSEARKKIRRVLDDFSPDVVHLNNFNYQLTPSIILEFAKWRKKNKKKCKLIYTAHDFQLICPNHMMKNPNTSKNCENCVNGHFLNCVKGRCIHSSFTKSLIGTLESELWNLSGVYKNIDTIICCSEFMRIKLNTSPIFREKTVTLYNFTDVIHKKKVQKKNYVLYFGRYSIEKGIRTLLQVCKELPDIPFVFVGSGPLGNEIENIQNVKNLGFQKGDALERIIREAKFSLCPSEWYENCPFTVIESIMYSTPVLGANIGGIPELIDIGVTGEVFESSNVNDLKQKILNLWMDDDKLAQYSDNCINVQFDTIVTYCEKLMKIYQ